MNQAPGQMLVTARFDAGPLGGLLEAKRTVEIVLPK